MLSSVNFAQPDITLKLDASGVIRSAILSSAISGEKIDHWVGRPWADTVSDGGNTQVRQILEDARTAGVSFFHQIRQRFPSGMELAVEYTTVRIGENEGLIALGRNVEAVSELRSRLIAAQKSMERDYWKLREIETRYRLLFDASTQPVMLINPADTRIVEANPAAIRALGVTSDRELLPEILASQRDTFRALLARVREQGKAPGIVMHLGPDRQSWLVRASLIAAEPAAMFVLQLSPSAGLSSLSAEKRSAVSMEQMIAVLPAGFVVLDTEGRIVRANRAFLDLIEQTTESAVLGQSLVRWLSTPEADDPVLLTNLLHHRAISAFPLKIRSELGTETAVELSTAGRPEEKSRYLGVLIHRTRSAPPATGSVSIPQLELVGRASLRDIVREAVTAVERRCIEAALKLVQGNRTAAAEMLGLSRQSLYAKLSRYSLELGTSTGSL